VKRGTAIKQLIAIDQMVYRVMLRVELLPVCFDA
jgi:hypothetical protein